jgi:hypothetical protein
MFPTVPPADVFDHFLRMLAPEYDVVTGHSHQLIWRVGGIQDDIAAQVITGRLGLQPREDELVPEWSVEAKDWPTEIARPKGPKLLPFGFDGESRLLTVLSDGKSSPTTIASVFEQILQKNEMETAEPTTNWSVETILDRADFLTWLGSVDVVASVSFKAKRPNPEPLDPFAELAERIDLRHATQYEETMRSTRDEGLTGIEKDRDFRQAIAMAQQGFASLSGKGKRDGRDTSYNQNRAVATETVDSLPEDWIGMRALIKQLLQGSLRTFKDVSGL